MPPMLLTLRDIVHEQVLRAREEPVDYLLRPGIKAVVMIGLLTVAAQVHQERAYDRKMLSKLSAGAKPTKIVTTGSVKR